MPKSSTPFIKALPAADEHWLVVIHRMRLWLTPPNEAPARPYGLFIFVLENGYALGSDLTPAVPTADQVQAALFKAMRKPPAVSGPARPIAHPSCFFECVLTRILQNSRSGSLVG